MKRIEKLVVPIAVLVIVAINNNVTEYLTGAGYPAPLILVSNGAIALLLNCTVCSFTKQRMFPRNWKFQLLRLFNNGISLLLIYESFRYLSAGSVGLIQRTDIPFVIMLSFFIGQRRSSMQFWLSLWTIFMIVFLIIDARMIDEDPFGFVLAFAGVILISGSYIMVTKSAAVESPYILSNVNSIGMTLVGTVMMFIKGYSWHISTEHIWIFCTGGLMVFAIYVVAVRLYIWYKPERARFPYILGALGTAVVEMIVEGKVYPASQIALIILISGMIMTISLNAPTPRYLHNGFGKMKKGLQNVKIKISQGIW